MIPAQNIVAWGNVVPWADQRQVEQDPIISRALVEIFSDAMLRDALRFRGGTALNKLHFPASLRYSEDIDLVRTSAGPIGPTLDQLHSGGGRLLVPEGPQWSGQTLTLYRKDASGEVRAEHLLAVRFVPMAHGQRTS